MVFPDLINNVHWEFDTQNCQLSSDIPDIVQNRLTTFYECVAHFPPTVDCYVTILHHARTTDYHVKTTLILSGKRLFTGDTDAWMTPAFERCIRKLIQKVEAYKSELGHESKRKKFEKGTHQKVHPTQLPDQQALLDAVENGDYNGFRFKAYTYEEPIRKRIGRWIQRYPEVDALIGDQLKLDDIVEEVFLNTFERYHDRPEEVPVGEWMEGLIDPSIKLLIEHPDEEMTNISFVRSMRIPPQ